jgi:hypothetical protein
MDLMKPDTDDRYTTRWTHTDEKPQYPQITLNPSETLRNSKGPVEGVKRMGYG